MQELQISKSDILSNQKKIIDKVINLKISDLGLLDYRKTNQELKLDIRDRSLDYLKSQKLKNNLYINRLDEELDIIEYRGYLRNFVVVSNIIDYMTKEKIVSSYGRGFVVSSLVSYCLEITKIDPIMNILKFERFLTKDKESIPDFDIDIASSKRDEVIDFVRSLYGQEMVKKSLIKLDDKIKIHPTSLEIKVTNEELVKIDLLSSKYIEKLARLKEIIEIEGKKLPDFRSKGLDNILDQKLQELLRTGDVIGCFQIGTKLGVKLTKKIDIQTERDVVNLLCLNRPGSYKYANNFSFAILENKVQDISKESKIIRDILSETKGVILYQEQIMEIGEKYFGISKEETNKFRKEFKLSNTKRKYSKEKILEYADKNGKDKIEMLKIYNKLDIGSKYVYNKAHALAYSQLTLESLYMKAYYPRIFREKVLSKKDYIREYKFIEENNIALLKEEEKEGRLICRNIEEKVNMKKDMDICVMEGINKKQAYDYAANMKEVRSLIKHLDIKERVSIELMSKEIYKGYIKTIIGKDNEKNIESLESRFIVNNNYKMNIVNKEKTIISLGYKELLNLTDKLNNNKYALLKTIETDQKEREIIDDNMNKINIIYNDINCNIYQDYLIDFIARKQVVNESLNKLVSLKSQKVLPKLESDLAFKINNEELNIIKEDAIKGAENTKEIMKDISNRNANNQKDVYLSREEMKEIGKVIFIKSVLNKEEVILDTKKEESVMQKEKQTIEVEKIISEYETKKELVQEQEKYRIKEQEIDIFD